MIRRFMEWLKGLFGRRNRFDTLTGVSVIYFEGGSHKPKLSYGPRYSAKSANICLARRTAMRHERENAYRTLRIVDADLRYLRGD